LVILSAVAAVAAAVVLSGRQHELAASAERRAAIPSGTATLLRLSPAAAEAAPGFTLTDQDGRVLSAIPGWYFFTGSGDALRAVWREYGIAVTASSPGGDLVHTATVYFIGPHGTERYTAAPPAQPIGGSTAYVPPGEISGWGKGIAQVVRAMLG
jgi:cytochrome oxidase Cu insertion factor (SCO1/SenC/PrrC family)